jgi:hypothetical protein
MEMRTGPAPGKDPDWKSAYQFGVISSAGKTFRNDGIGWYPTDDAPGIGLDPRTAALLPDLLRHATAVADGGTKPINGADLAMVTGFAKVADVPGVIASDARASPSSWLRSNSPLTTRVASPRSTSSPGTRTSTCTTC